MPTSGYCFTHDTQERAATSCHGPLPGDAYAASVIICFSVRFAWLMCRGRQRNQTPAHAVRCEAECSTGVQIAGGIPILNEDFFAMETLSRCPIANGYPHSHYAALLSSADSVTGTGSIFEPASCPSPRWYAGDGRSVMGFRRMV